MSSQFSKHLTSQARHHARRSARRGLATVTDAPKKPYRLVTAVIVNRAPVVTRTPTAFEQSYYEYNARIQRAISNPFSNDFYFKPGSIIEHRFAKEERQREREAFGPEFGVEPEASKDKIDEKELMMEEAAKPMSRRTAADESGDIKSLDRSLERHLYLLVQQTEGSGSSGWRFPQGPVEKDEFLHNAAERNLADHCGKHMDIWLVARKPIGLVTEDASSPASEFVGDKTFFMKAHILAGQARPTTGEFAWLTKEEIQQRVQPEYWSAVQDLLST